MTELQTAAPPTERHGHWKWFLALGACLVALGLTGTGAASLLALTSVLLFGPLLLASAFIQLLTAFCAEQGKEALLHFLAAGLEGVLGFLVIARPFESVVSLVVLIAVFLVAIGLARLALALVAKSRRRGWVAVTGVVAILLGVSVWLGGPAVAVWFVGLCIALDFLCHGFSWALVGPMGRKPLESLVP